MEKYRHTDGSITDISDYSNIEKEIFIETYPDAVLIEEEPGKTNGLDAVVNAEEPKNTVSNGAIGSSVLKNKKTGRQKAIDEKRSIFDVLSGDAFVDKAINDIIPVFGEELEIISPQDALLLEDDTQYLDDTVTGIKANTLTAAGGVARTPTWINEIFVGLERDLPEFLGGMSDEQQKQFDSLPVKAQQILANNKGLPGMGMSFDMLANLGLKYFDKANKEADKLRSTMKVWDSTPVDDLKNGDYAQGAARALSEAVQSIPSMVQAAVPYVGIASIVAGSGARASSEAQDKGMGMGLKTAGYSAIIGGSEGLLELVTKRIGGRMFKDLAGTGKEFVKQTISSVLLKVSKDFGSEGLSEGGTEFINTLADKYVLGDEEAFIDFWSRLWNVVLVGGISGGGMSSTGSSVAVVRQINQIKSLKKDLKTTEYETLADAYKDNKTSLGITSLSTNNNTEKFLDFQLKDMVSSGDMTVEESDSIRENFRDSQQASNQLSNVDITADDIGEATDLLQEKNRLNKDIKSSNDPILTEDKKDRVAEIDLKLSEIIGRGQVAKASGDIDAEVELIKNVAKNVENVTIEALENEEAISDFMKDKGYTDEDIKESKGDQGFIVQDKKTGKQLIIINKEVASKEQAVTVTRHEFLHALLFNTLKDNPEAQVDLGNSLKEYINKIDATQIKDSNFLKRLNQYKNESKEVQGEETLTLFSDAIRNGDIKFDENIFTSLGDVLRRTLQSLGVKVKFNTGKDVYNFIKDYNVNLDKGKLNSAQISASKGVKGDLVSKSVKKSDDKVVKKSISNVSVKAKEYIDLVKEGVFTNESLADIVNSRSSKEADRFAAIDAIVEGNWPVISKAIKFNPTGKIPMSSIKTAVTEQFQGIFPGRNKSLLDGYSSTKSKVNTFIGSLLGKRQAEILERAKEIGESKFEGESLDSEQAKQVAVEETSSKSSAPDVKPTIDPFKITPAINEKQFVEAVAKNIKDKNITDTKDLSYKKIGEVTPYKIVADAFGIPESRISNPKDNLRKSDGLTKIQMWVSKNAPTLKNLLPLGNVEIQKLSAVGKQRATTVGGESNKLPGNLVDAFYDKVLDSKGKHVKKRNALQYIIKPNISLNDFKLAFGIDKDGNIKDPRGPEAQAMKGLLEVYARNLTNKAARIIEDVKIDEGKQTESEGAIRKAEIARGKPKLMLSKKLSKELRDEIAVPKSLKKKILTYGELTPDQIKKYTELSTLRDKNKLGKALDFKTESIGPDTRIALQLKVLEAAVEFGMTYEMIAAGNMESGGRWKVRGKIKDGVFKPVSALLGGKSYYQTTDPNNKYILATDKNKNADTRNDWVAKQGKLYYGVTDPAYQALMEAVGGKEKLQQRKIPVPTKGYINSAWKKTKKAQEKINMDALDRVVNQLADAVNNGMSLEVAGLIVIQSYQATSGLIKIAAPFNYVSKIMDYGTGKNKLGNKKFREEHNPPASVIGAQIMWAIKNNAAAPVMEAIKKNYYQTQLSKKDDSNLDDANLDATLPKGVTIFDNPVIRLSDALIDLNTLDNIVTGKTMAEENGVYVDKSISSTPESLSKQKELIQKQFEDKLFTKEDSQKEMNQFAKLVPNKIMSSKSNNDMLPKFIKYSQPIDIQTGIDALAKSDKALDNARKFDQPIKKIRVFDFDDTLARTKSNVLYTMPGENVAYNASPKTFDQLGERTGLIFLATDIKEAQEYAKSNRGEVRTISVNDSSLATEDQVLDQMNSLNIDTSEGLLYEMIDSRFEDFYIGNANLNKLKKALKQNGFGGFKYSDGSQISSKGTESIAVIDKSIINEPNKINAAEFAERSEALTSEGAQFDFSEFSKVMEGKKGPLFEVAKIIADKRGTDDVFVLTARPANAAGPIQEFLKSIGLNIPLNNITGLGNGDPQAKAGWVVGKAAEGYNDFYFADDATGNVKAVKEALSVLDVKSKVQQAYIKSSKKLDLEFNKIIENKTGIAAEKNYARVKGELAGQKKGRFNIFIPPSAEDFVGLLYKTLGKGKVGDSQMKWYKDNLLTPYARAMDNITKDRNTLGSNFRALKKELKVVPKDLKKKLPGTVFTKEQAVRVFIWNQQGNEVPGLSKADLKELNDIVKNDPKLTIFAQQIIKLNKGTGYVVPTDSWTSGTITTDLIQTLNTVKRKEYLEQWQQNVDVIFSEKNLNKMEAAYGKPYREAMDNILGRMKTGTNRTFGGDTLTGRFTDWLNGSTAAIMFFNTRSAVLQTISAVNFINFKENNVFAAGKAFANQPQYWKDFVMLYNSDFLVDRRDGLKININESDIANIAKERGVRGVISKLLKVGFTPTQLADSFAIASGGSTFYRTKIKGLVKDGMDLKSAEKQAMLDFREIAEESQQSSRPDKISSQQAGPLGRIVLAFANTPAQYARLIKKAASDLKNGRGDAKSNISKIMYYGVAQNLLFNSLQQALFAISFGDEEEDLEEDAKELNKKRKEKKQFDILNGMADSILRGTGIGGAIFGVVKNTAIKLYEQSEKKNPKYEDAALELLKISPPVSSKIQKIRSASRTFSWNMAEMKAKGWSLDSPAYLAGGNIVSAVTNIPLDRLIKKYNHLKSASDEELETYKRMALVAGWGEWELGIKKEKFKKPRKTKTPSVYYPTGF